MLIVLFSCTLQAQKDDAIAVSTWGNGAGGDRYLLLTLQTPGNVNRLTLEIDGLSTQQLQRSLNVFITYDPMNPGSPVTYTVKGAHPFDLVFPARYGAHVKLLFRGGITKKPLSVREVHIGYAAGSAVTAAVLGTVTTSGAAGRPWLDVKMPLEQRVESILSVMTPADKMELLREGWGIPGIPRLGIPAMNKVEAIH
ncbi:MAG TPA: hypothetical protein VHC48_19140, partial [Puia sp.]|nr:hypothetical protein [Puia sp.]